MHLPMPTSHRRHESLWTALVLLLGVAAVLLALRAVQGKSSTFDEPLHALAAAVSWHPDGLLLNPEHPPVWKYYARLATGYLPVELPPPVVEQLTKNPDAQWFVAWREMYQQPAARGQPMAGEQLVARARVLMTLVLLPIGLLTYALARMLMAASGLPSAVARPFGLAASAMVLFEPNLLAHAPLVTNDLFMVLWTLAVACLLMKYRQPGQRKPLWLIAVAVCTGLALATKFSAVALLVAAVLVVAIDAAQNRSWKHGLLGLTILAVLPYAVIWGVYGFKYSPTPDAAVAFDLNAAADRVAVNRRLADAEKAGGQSPTAAPQPTPDGTTRTLLWLNDHRFLPQAYLHGLTTSYGLTRFNNGYLLGEVRGTGWAWYFLVAYFVKTPLGGLLLVLSGLAAMFAGGWKHCRAAAWPVLVVAGSYAAFAAATPLNIGFRHLFPVLPFLVTLAVSAVAAAGVIHKMHRRLMLLVWACFIGLVIELHTTFPHWIAFFNWPARFHGPAKLLSDSNLDWGQDLTLLADWRRQHPDGTLHLAYFGTADPQLAYGLQYANLHGGYDLGPPPTFPLPDQPGYLAVSATVLQGTYTNPQLRGFYQTVSKHTPVAVLGGTIHIFKWPFPNTPNPHPPATDPNLSPSN
jgi:hypothetical protein